MKKVFQTINDAGDKSTFYFKEHTPPFLRTAYNYDMNAAGDESALRCDDGSRTKQSFKEDTDINTIVERFGITGQLPENVRMPTYGDFTSTFDFQSSMNAVRHAEESFMMMPANVRARFHNNPQEFVEFCSNDDNRDEAKKLGLVSPEALQRDLDAAAAAKAASTPPTGENPPKPPKEGKKE